MYLVSKQYASNINMGLHTDFLHLDNWNYTRQGSVFILWP